MLPLSIRQMIAHLVQTHVILHELLSGSTPHSHIKEVEHEAYWILESYWDFEIPKPSQRAAGLTADARTRVPAELDFITMRALARDRNQRYQTVAEYAKDLQHFLNGESVEAVGPGAPYRLKKLAARNRAITAAIILLGATIISTAIVRTSYAVRVHRAEQQANQRLNETLLQKENAAERDDKQLTTHADGNN